MSDEAISKKNVPTSIASSRPDQTASPLTLSSDEFAPFYEPKRYDISASLATKIMVSLFLGLIFLGIHFAQVKGQIFSDWSFLLSLIITSAMLCLYYATHTLQSTFPELDMRLQPQDNTLYKKSLETHLSDGRFIMAGVGFGFVNCGFGYFFGNPYGNNPGSLTIYSGFFLTGFVCGMAAYGIVGVLLSLNKISYKLKSSLDFTSPDHCGGTTFLGEALVIFGSVTLFVGVLISMYIWKAPWKAEPTNFILFLKWFWMAFPYVMSLIALIGPAIGVNRALREYKIEEKGKLMGDLSTIQKLLRDKSLANEKKQGLQSDFDFLTSRRRELHEMRTWPFGFGANLTYVGVVVVNVSASTESVFNWWEKLIKG